MIRNRIIGWFWGYRGSLWITYYISAHEQWFYESFKSEEKELVEMSDLMKKEKYMHRIQDLLWHWKSLFSVFLEGFWEGNWVTVVWCL